MIVSSTEPKSLQMLGDAINTKPEQFGLDFMWWVPSLKGWGGVQRKEIKDLIASIRDGRLGRELVQMEAAKLKMLCVEGRWTTAGEMVMADKHTTIPARQFHSVLWGLQQQGIMVTYSSTMKETARVVAAFEDWTKREKHSSLPTQAKVASIWGDGQNKGYGVHLLTAFDGIGPQLASDIYDHFGCVPLSLAVEDEAMLEVPGMGPGRLEKLKRSLRDDQTDLGGP